METKKKKKDSLTQLGESFFLLGIFHTFNYLLDFPIVDIIQALLMFLVLLSCKSLKKELVSSDPSIEKLNQFWKSYLVATFIIFADGIYNLIYNIINLPIFETFYFTSRLFLFTGYILFNFLAWRNLEQFFLKTNINSSKEIRKQSSEKSKILQFATLIYGTNIIYIIIEVINSISPIHYNEIIKNSIYIIVITSHFIGSAFFYYGFFGLSGLLTKKEESLPKIDTDRFTKDFGRMMNVVIWNSMAFFFLEFMIYIYANQTLGASGTQIGIIASVTVLGKLTSSSFMGWVTDHVKRKRNLIAISTFIRGGAYFLIYFALLTGSLIGITLCSFLLGFSWSMFWIPLSTLIAGKSAKEHRSYAFGKRDFNVGIGIVIGAFIGFTFYLIGSMEDFLELIINKNSLIIVNTPAPIIMFFGIPLVGICCFIGGINFLRDVDESIIFLGNNSSDNTSSDMNPNEENSSNKLKNSVIFGSILLLILILLGSINGSTARPFYNIYIINFIVTDPYLASFVYLPSSLYFMLSPKLGNLVDKLQPIAGITMTSVAGVILTWLLINTKDPFMFAIILLFDMSIANTGMLIFQNLMSRMTIKHRGKIMGISAFFGNLGGILGPILGGFTWDINPDLPFIITMIVELCLIPLWMIVIRLITPNMAESYDFKDKKSSNTEYAKQILE
ncbi:MAG: MFS transporter [archaeon]|nr:MFS transporter [archaeon]